MQRLVCVIVLCVANMGIAPVSSQPLANLDGVHREKDSIRLLLSNHLEPERLSNVYIRLTQLSVQLFEFDSAVHYATRATEAAAVSNNQRLLMEALRVMSLCYSNAGLRDYQKCVAFERKALSIAAANEWIDEQHSIYSAILNCYFYLGDFTSAMEVTEAGLLLAKTHSSERHILQYNGLLGFINLRQGNYEDALKYYAILNELAREAKDSLYLADSYNGIGEANRSKGEYRTALEQYAHAWRTYKAMDPKRLHFRRDQLAYTAFRLCEAHLLLNDLDNSSSWAQTGLELIRRCSPNEYDRVIYYGICSKLALAQGKPVEAMTLAYRSLALAKGVKHRENIRDSYELLSQIHYALRNTDSAYQYHVRYTNLKDTIVNERTRQQIERIHNEFDHLQKDHALALQETELRSQTTQRNAVVILFVLSIIIALLFYNRYRLKLKSEFQSKVTEQQRELLRTIVNFQDSERQRVARDIHDNLGSLLSAAKIQLSSLDSCKESFSHEQWRRYQNSLALLDEASVEIRNIASDIMPAALAKLGLIPALKALIEKVSASAELQVDFNAFGFEERLNEKIEMSIYALILEPLQNIIKHSGATSAVVQLIRHAEVININIEDNGRGFEKSADHPGSGLRNIVNRVKYLNGTIEIDSTPGKGTWIVMELPHRN